MWENKRREKEGDFLLSLYFLGFSKVVKSDSVNHRSFQEQTLGIVKAFIHLFINPTNIYQMLPGFHTLF